MKKVIFLSALVGIIMLFALNANATHITGKASLDGVQVLNDDTGRVGLWDSADVIEYFIPIDRTPIVNGVYGDNSYGTFSDTETAPLGGARMDMFIYFDIGAETADTLTLWFDDLDLQTNNTPGHQTLAGFFETIAFNNTGLLSKTTDFTHWTDLEAESNVSFGGPIPSSNRDVTITISGLTLTGDFWLNLEFMSGSKGLSGNWYNTPEFLSATLSTAPVPEPATIALLGIGIVGFAGAAARRKLRKSQNKVNR